jgi:hypothetical protein
MGLMPQKYPLGKGKHLIVLHAGTRSEGLIDGCDLVFLLISTDGDNHQKMGISSRKGNVVLYKIVLENSFFLTKICAYRIFCFNIVVKGFVAKNNTTFRLKDVKELTFAAFGKITKDMWTKA